ncbi:MAG TPA: hypothetical protein VMQ93_12065 [Novosphingobium sp.]|nr:hypothetical protein [Novosphingobium sp.]
MTYSPARYHAEPRRSIPGEAPEIARLTAMAVALLQELAITRERLDTVERMGEAAGWLDRAALDAYRAEGAAEAERNATRRRLIDVVMHPFKADAERALEATRENADRAERTRTADAILEKEQLS